MLMLKVHHALSIFVAAIDYANIFTMKISRITVLGFILPLVKIFWHCYCVADQIDC